MYRWWGLGEGEGGKGVAVDVYCLFFVVGGGGVILVAAVLCCCVMIRTYTHLLELVP